MVAACNKRAWIRLDYTSLCKSARRSCVSILMSFCMCVFGVLGLEVLQQIADAPLEKVCWFYETSSLSTLAIITFTYTMM